MSVQRLLVRITEDSENFSQLYFESRKRTTCIMYILYQLVDNNRTQTAANEDIGCRPRGQFVEACMWFSGKLQR